MSSSNAAWSRRLRPGSSSTRKSTSLAGPASPRATEPKTQTLRAPCRAAKDELKRKYLEEFKAHTDYTSEDMKEFGKVVKTINDRFAPSKQ